MKLYLNNFAISGLPAADTAVLKQQPLFLRTNVKMSTVLSRRWTALVNLFSKITVLSTQAHISAILQEAGAYISQYGYNSLMLQIDARRDKICPGFTILVAGHAFALTSELIAKDAEDQVVRGINITEQGSFDLLRVPQHTEVTPWFGLQSVTDFMSVDNTAQDVLMELQIQEWGVWRSVAIIGHVTGLDPNYPTSNPVANEIAAADRKSVV